MLCPGWSNILQPWWVQPVNPCWLARVNLEVGKVTKKSKTINFFWCKGHDLVWICCLQEWCVHFYVQTLAYVDLTSFLGKPVLGRQYRCLMCNIPIWTRFCHFHGTPDERTTLKWIEHPLLLFTDSKIVFEPKFCSIPSTLRLPGIPSLTWNFSGLGNFNEIETWSLPCSCHCGFRRRNRSHLFWIYNFTLTIFLLSFISLTWNQACWYHDSELCFWHGHGKVKYFFFARR